MGRQAIKKRIDREKKRRGKIKVSEPERVSDGKKEQRKKWLKRERRRVLFTKEKHMRTDIVWRKPLWQRLLSTERREMEFNFSLSQKVWGKSPTLTLGWCKHIHVTYKHTLTFQTEHGSSLISPFIHKKQIPASFSALPSHSAVISLFLALLSSPPLPLSLHRSVKAFTHRRTNPDTYTPLSRCLSRHLPSHTHMYTLRVAASQLLHCRKLLRDPPHSASPLALSLHLWMSLHHASQSPPHLSTPVSVKR